MNQVEIKILEKLNFHGWYSKLIDKYAHAEEEIFLKSSRKEIEQIINDFGYLTQYYSSSKIFSIPTKFDGIEFYCNPQLNFGDVRAYMYCEKGEKRFGDSLISMCRLYEIAIGKDSGYYMLSPRFRSYKEMKDILKAVFEMYELFKVVVYESRIFDHPA